MKFNGELNENARTEMEQIFEESSIEYVPVFSVYRMFDGNDRKAAIEVIAAEPERFASMISLFDGNTRKEAELPAEGVVVTQRVAETYNFKEGDPIVLYDSLLNPHESRIALIMENYFGLNLYMTFDAYRACFGVDQQPNVFYLKGIDDLEALTRRIESIDGYESIEDYRAVYESYSWFVSLLTLLTVVLTVTAGLMAYFVLLNLFTMYYNQKKREITIMRVNGFTTRECIQYISRESVITTVLGIVLGIVVGALIGNVILEQLQQAQARFVYEIYWQGILFSALISGVYSLLINALVMRKVKDLKLRDIA